MPRVLFVNQSKNFGSTGKIVEQIGMLAESHGWEVRIAHSERYERNSHFKSLYFSSVFSEKWHALCSYLFDCQGLCSKRKTKFLIQRIREFKPDIVHLHNIHGYFINYWILFNYLNKKDIPVVWTFHDCWPFTGHCGHFVRYNCKKWQTKCHHCPATHGYPASLFIDNSKFNFWLKKKTFTAKENLYITTVSQWLAGVVKSSFFKDFSIRVVYDSVDTDVFHYRESHLREKYGIEDKVVLLAAAANWTTTKGWNDYIKLSKMLPTECVIMLLGVKERERMDLPKEIIAVSRVEGKEKLAEYYSMADILLNLSYQETFGMTTAEAMSCGTPGISYNVTACPELLTPETGIVVNAGNLQQVIEAISTIRKKGKESYSQACRERAMTVFDSKKVNSLFFDIYNKVLGLEK